MTTLTDFQSLLQLGAGIGVGLSFFRAGFDRKSKGLRTRLTRALNARSNPANAEARGALVELTGLKTRYNRACVDTERAVKAFQSAAMVGGLVNMSLLVVATWEADYELTQWGLVFATWWSLGYFASLLLGLELWLWLRFRRITSQLAKCEEELPSW